MRGMESAYAKILGSSTAIPCPRRRAERGLPLSGSAVPRLQHPPDRGAGRCSSAEGEKVTPIHELERYMRCKDCSQVRGYPYKRSHLVALRTTKISAGDPPSTWWPGER